MSMMSLLGMIGLVSVSALAVPSAAEAKPTVPAAYTLSVAGVSCTITPSQKVDPQDQKASFGTKTTCGGAGVDMEQSFSDVEDCEDPTTQITPGPGLDEVTVKQETTCKNSASGKAGVSSSSSASDPSGSVMFTGTQTSEGSGKAGEKSTVGSTSTFKLSTGATAARQQEFTFDASNSAAFTVSNEAPVTAAQFLQVTGF